MKFFAKVGPLRAALLVAGLSCTTGGAFAQSLANLKVAPVSVIGGKPSTGTVTLSEAAPKGGYLVTLTTSHPAEVVLPGSITVAAGSRTATFPIQTNVNTTTVDYTIFAKDAKNQKTATLAVLDDTILSIGLTPNTIYGGDSTMATVTLRHPAPVGGWKVSLTSQWPAYVTIPEVAIVPAGATALTMPVTTKPDRVNFTNKITARDAAKSDLSTILKVDVGPKSISIPIGASDIAYDSLHDRLLVAPRSGNGTLLVINPATGALARTITLPTAVSVVTMSSDSSSIFIGCPDNSVRVIDSASYKVKLTIPVSGNPVSIVAIPKTKLSFAVCTDPWTTIYDGAVARPNNAAIGIVQAINASGTHFVGADYRYSPNNYAVALINARGFYNQATGYGPVSPNLTDQAGYPVDGYGNVLNPNTAQRLYSLPFVVSSNRELSALPDGVNLICLSWAPNTAQIINIEKRSSLGTFPLLNTDGGLGKVIYAGPHRIAYFNFGYISDFQTVIVTDPLIP